MSGRGRRKKKGLQSEQSNDGATGIPSRLSSGSSAVIRKLRDQRKQVTNPEMRKAMARVHRTAILEMEQWQKELIKIIKTETSIHFNRDGTWQFVLPPSLVNLHYETQLNEYMKARSMTREEAIGAVRVDLEGAAVQIEAARAAKDDVGRQGQAAGLPSGTTPNPVDAREAAL